MKAIILAGGHATRLWPITKNRAKPLLPLGDRPIIDYMVEELENEGLEEIIISTNRKYSGDFEQYAEEYGRDTVNVIVEEQDSEEEKPGTIGAILKIMDQEPINDDLLIVGGDNYFPFQFSELFSMFRSNDGLINAVYDVQDIEMAKQFGIVDVNEDNQKIVGFREKPEEPPSTLASTACYLFPEDQVSLFREYEEHFKQTDVPKDKYLDEPGRLIEWAHKKAPMYAFSFSGDWFDVGTPEGYLNATDSVTDGKMINGEVEDSEIGENVVIMKGAEVEGSELENTIVFPGATIINSQVENSLIDREALIEYTDLDGAVIGEYSKL